MAELFRPTYTFIDPVTEKRVTRRSKTWHVRYYTPDGMRRRVKGYRDKKATEALGVRLERRAARLAEGLVDALDEPAARPLADHLTAYCKFLLDKDCVPRHVQLTCARIKACLDACRFVKIADVQPSAVQGFLADLRRPRKVPDVPPEKDAFTVPEAAEVLGIQPASVNTQLRRGRLPFTESNGERLISRDVVQRMSVPHTAARSVTSANGYLTAMKAFTRWLWRDKRAAADPLAGMSRLPAEGDGDCRRPLEPSELVRLLDAAGRSGLRFRGLDGTDRRMLYALAAGSGLRAAELASLRPESFDLEGTPPTATVAAAYAKNGQTAVQPLPLELADALRPYLAAKFPGQAIWPGTWFTKAFEMIRADLEAAGIAYRDAAGRRRDFHSLRHTYITNLVRGGANPKVAQVLARHSTVQLTLGRYAHAALYDQAAAVEALPRMLGAGKDHVLAATGTC